MDTHMDTSIDIHMDMSMDIHMEMPIKSKVSKLDGLYIQSEPQPPAPCGAGATTRVPKA